MSTKGLNAVTVIPTPVTSRASLPVSTTTTATTLDSFTTSAAQSYLANHPNLGLLTAAYFKAIRCTLPNCRCECFSPGKTSLRTCETCKHGWVAHALDKLGYRSMYQMGMHVEIVQPNIVFDIASLMLYGAQATPVRLKILLDRLFSVLQHEEVLQVLHGFNWTYEDYARGYILQDSNGRVLDKWLIATHDEEQIILQQFLRFGETKSIAQEIILQDTRENRERSMVNSPKNDSEIKKFIERSNLSMQNYLNKYQQARQLMGATNLSNFVTSSGSTPARIISPTAMPAFSPSSAGSGRSVSSEPMNMSMQNSSPVTSSPLSRLQTMQPFDYRREHLSPTVSPVASGKSTPPSSGSKSPENLSISTRATTPPLSTTPNSMLTPKQELDDSKYSAIMSSDDSSDGAINYSMKEGSSTSPSSVYADRKIKNLRKSSNPVKRQWQPNPSFGSTFISPSGKKRVLCTACNKTFCDKGALKIHYSAVHLKEMHKCTVEGCNMMFSSRRSRNRHSANPNPKLHMPNAKRKYPDGSSMIDECKYETKKVPSSLPSSLPGMPPGMTVPCLPAFPMPAIAPEVKIPKSEPGLVTEIAPVLTPENYFMNPNSFLPSPSKVPKMEESGLVSDLSLDSRKDISTRSASKRKSLMPTRCTVTEEIFVMSDDNSNDEIDRDYDSLPQDLSLKDNSHKSEIDADDAKTIEDDCDEAEVREVYDDAAVTACGPEENGHAEMEENNDMPVVNGETNGMMEDHDTQDSLNGEMVIDHNGEGSYDENSGHSSDNDSDVEMHSLRSNGHGLQDIDIPLDKDNPRKCSMCGKLFNNHFGLRTHFQNVHLKLMHTCTVEGCNAAFPSKRSRDRHSSNLNLHRKLLSTAPNNSDDKSPSKTTGQNLRDEFLPRIYSSFNNNNGKYEDLEEGELAPISLVTNNVMMASTGGPASPDATSDGCEMSDIEQDDDSPKPDPDGTVKCHICKQRFRDNLVLKEHYEKVHPKEMYHCTINGCDKIFSTRKSRNRHSQNENLHRHLSPTKINGTA